MKAITQDRYGSPDVLSLTDVDRPAPRAGEVLIRVRAAGVDRAYPLAETADAVRHLAAGRARGKVVVTVP